MTQSLPQDDRTNALIDADTPVLDLRRYLLIIRKRIWVIAAVLAVGITSAVLYTQSVPKVYQATARVVIDPIPPQVFGSQVQEVIQLGAGSYWSNQEYYNTQLEILTRYELLERTMREDCERYGCAVVDALAAAAEIPGDGPPLTPEQRQSAATELLAGLITADQTRESRIVNLNVQYTDPELAVDIANRHVQTFIDYHSNLRGENTSDIIDFLASELDRAKRELGASEQALLDMRRESGILSMSLEDRQNLLATDIARYNAALSDARIKRIELGTLRRRAQSLSDQEVMESPIFALADSGSVVDKIKEQFVREQHRLAELAQELGPRHPAYQSQLKKTEEQRRALQAEARRAMRELDERYQAALARERAFQSEVDRLKGEAFALSSKAVGYNQLQRKQESDEEKYKLVLSRLSASRLSKRNTASNVQLHMIARTAELVYPRMSINLAVAVMLSLMLGLGLAFLIDLLDRTLKSPEQVERVVGAPLLGIIPGVRITAGSDRDSRRQRDLYVFHNPDSAAAEHCRSIRTNILFSSMAKPMKVLTVSSPQQGEGKTTSLVYMGTIMAQSGQRVLLVDTDMRKPRLDQSLGTSAGRGLSNLLLPDAAVDELLDAAIQPTEIANLHLLPCGPRPPNPAELLLTERFGTILEALSKRFDRVLLDSPPLLLMNDAVVLSRLSDGVILVAQAGKTSVDQLQRAAQMLRHVDAPIPGVILNDMDVSSSQYGSYYRYGYESGDEPAPSQAGQAA